MTSLHALGAAELSAGFAAGGLSPVEVATAALDRIAAWEPSINAMYLVHRESALAAARESQARWRAGAQRSALDGVPITLKENIHTRGDPSPVGCVVNDLTPQADDAPVAARAREAGCVILGKTTMPDYGMLSAGLSSIHGITRNPWRLDRNTSGSSSGAAAAVVAGYGPLHVGTDIGGSVRLPATHGGFFGLKPSLGRIPIDPPYMGRVAGPMTRTVRDSAMLLVELSRPDARDFMSLPYREIDYPGALEGLAAKGLRVGFLPDMGVGLAVDPEVGRAAHAAASALERAGAVVERIPSFMTEAMLEGIQLFFEARSYNEVRDLPESALARIHPFIVEWCTWRAGGFTGADVMNGYTQVVLMREAAVRATAPFDFLISPTSPIPPYEVELPSPTDDPHDALPHIAFTVAYNMSEQPAASLNWDYTPDGLPLGVQVIGKRFDDLGVLRMSRLLEQLRPAQRAWPEPG